MSVEKVELVEKWCMEDCRGDKGEMIEDMDPVAARTGLSSSGEMR